jgi:hypothetical protein
MPTPEKLENAFVGLTVLVLLAAGCAYLIVPNLLFAPVGITARNEGMVDLRATYASGQIAVALYLAWLMWNEARRPFALPLVCTLLSTVALARSYALLAEQVYSGLMLRATVVEAIAALFAAALLLRKRRPQ